MEKYYKNLTVKNKLKKAFSSILVLFFIVLITSMLALILIGTNIRKFRHVSFTNCLLQEEIRRDLQTIDKMVLWSMTTDSLDETKIYLEKADTYAQEMDTNIEALKSTFPDQDHILELEEILAEIKEVRMGLCSYARVNDNERALEIFNGKYSELNMKLQDVLSELDEHSMEDADQQYAFTLIVSIISGTVIIILGVLVYIFVNKISKVLASILLQPITEIEAATEEMKIGNLDVTISYDENDELGSLATNFKETCVSLHEIVGDIDYLLNEMANNNFDIHSKKEEKYVGQFSNLLLSIRKMNHQLDETLKQISVVSDSVASGSSQLATSAQELAEGATEQAGAIEELTATIEDVTSIAKESAKSADGAYQMIKSVVSNAQSSQEDLQDLTNAMIRISDTSKEIQNIIASIEDIADQTNLLSLNASIEAARAGEAGKGFAVVADQIGKLAADSAQSAANTRTLINKAIDEVENGNIVTEKTVNSLNNILQGMSSFAETARGTSQASDTQAEMLGQIQDGIEQISHVVQSNSAAAQQTSATSEELSAQSENLKTLVRQFKLKQ